MKHILGIDVIPTNNEQILHLFDTSMYAEGLGITCRNLEIIIPGFRNEKVINTVAYFNLALNAVDLGIIGSASSELPALPDGIYHIKYSVSPADKVYVEFDHLRTVSFNKDIFLYRCKLNLGSCTPSTEIHKSLRDINEVEDYLKSAIAAVEYCEDSDVGIELYFYAKKLFDRLSKKFCC